MTDNHDIIAFSVDGEKILGVVIEHYTNPLDDFYIVYADYALHKSHNPDEDADLVIDNVIIPACDAAIAEYRLKRQHLRDMDKCHRDIEALIGAINSDMETDGLFEDKL
jgi:hypothetical protein